MLSTVCLVRFTPQLVSSIWQQQEDEFGIMLGLSSVLKIALGVASLGAMISDEEEFYDWLVHWVWPLAHGQSCY